MVATGTWTKPPPLRQQWPLADSQATVYLRSLPVDNALNVPQHIKHLAQCITAMCYSTTCSSLVSKCTTEWELSICVLVMTVYGEIQLIHLGCGLHSTDRDISISLSVSLKLLRWIRVAGNTQFTAVHTNIHIWLVRLCWIGKLWDPRNHMRRQGSNFVERSRWASNKIPLSSVMCSKNMFLLYEYIYSHWEFIFFNEQSSSGSDTRKFCPLCADGTTT